MMKNKTISKKLVVQILCLIASTLLWIFVIFEMDPIDKKFLSNVKINIVNKEELAKQDLIPSIGQNPVANIRLDGKRSLLFQEANDLNVLDVHIENPKIGKNRVKLKINDLDPQIQTTITPTYVDIELEQLMTKNLPIEVVTVGTAAENTFVTNISIEPKTVFIQGPKSQIEKVEKAVAEVNLDMNKHDFSKMVQIKFLSQDEQKLGGITSSETNVLATVGINTTKSVPIILRFDQDGYRLPDHFTLDNTIVNIKGPAKDLEKITQIYSKTISVEKLENTHQISVSLEKPQHGTLEKDKVNIINQNYNPTNEENDAKIEEQKNNQTQEDEKKIIHFTKEDVEIVGNYQLKDNEDIKDFIDIPKIIICEITYKKDENIKEDYTDKKNYNLTLDLSSYNEETNTIKLMVDTNLSHKEITLNPDEIQAKEAPKNS